MCPLEYVWRGPPVISATRAHASNFSPLTSSFLIEIASPNFSHSPNTPEPQNTRGETSQSLVARALVALAWLHGCAPAGSRRASSHVLTALAVDGSRPPGKSKGRWTHGWTRFQIDEDMAPMRTVPFQAAAFGDKAQDPSSWGDRTVRGVGLEGLDEVRALGELLLAGNVGGGVAVASPFLLCSWETIELLSGGTRALLRLRVPAGDDTCID